MRAADTKRLVIAGRAGTGKTRLFCDVATRRIAEGRPTLLVLGQDFDARNLLPQFAEITQLGGGIEAAIASFAAAAEASGHLGLVMIDALNESERPGRWRDDLRTLLSVVGRYENVAMTVSCRTEFVDAVLGDEDRPMVEHPGFAEATDQAISRYTEEYGLEPPTFPVLGPEFSNPLYLKLTCEALSTPGATRFPFGAAGVMTVCEAFLDAVNRFTSIAERAPVGFATGLARFAGINDPYVTERLAGAACGAALRTDDEETVRSLADGVSALLADCWPDHLLTRDYACRVVEAARARGWTGSLPAPAPGARPMPARAAEEIDALAGPPDYAYSSIWHSLTGMGDLGRYALTPALEYIAVDDEQKLARDVERAVFERVLDLGWTPECFKDLDRGRLGGHDGVVERVGKKYQWIAFYEVLGRLTDHHLVKPGWGDDAHRPYEHAEQLIWRDIDPTVLVRKPPRQRE